MTTRVINDPASLQRLGMLAEQMTRMELDLAALGEDALARSDVYGAGYYRSRAARCGRVGMKARETLVRISGLTESDVRPEPQTHVHTDGCGFLPCEPPGPPATLVGLVDWLRARLGRWFPYAPSEVWQGVGFVLMQFRRPS